MTETSPTDDRLGALEETSDGWQLLYVRHLAKPPTAVWPAFVDPALVKEWFPTSIIGDLTVGSDLTFEIKDFDAEPFEGSVLEVDEPHLVAFTWGPDTLRFTLREADGGTELTLTVILSEQGKAARDGAGWHECLDALGSLLADGADDAENGASKDLGAAYKEHFGPEASTIGPPQAYLDAQESSSSSSKA